MGYDVIFSFTGVNAAVTNYASRLVHTVTATASSTGAKAFDQNSVVCRYSQLGRASTNPPDVHTINPLPGASFHELAEVAINITASDRDGEVRKVDLYRDSTLVQTRPLSLYLVKRTAWHLFVNCCGDG